jgi:hypothetical protein
MDGFNVHLLQWQMYYCNDNPAIEYPITKKYFSDSYVWYKNLDRSGNQYFIFLIFCLRFFGQFLVSEKSFYVFHHTNWEFHWLLFDWKLKSLNKFDACPKYKMSSKSTGSFGDETCRRICGRTQTFHYLFFVRMSCEEFWKLDNSDKIFHHILHIQCTSRISENIIQRPILYNIRYKFSVWILDSVMVFINT